jgi:hypothetical protein
MITNYEQEKEGGHPKAPPPQEETGREEQGCAGSVLGKAKV